MLEALRTLADRPGRPIDVVSDSTYVVNCFRDRWWVKWQANGWRNSQKQAGRQPRPVEAADRAREGQRRDVPLGQGPQRRPDERPRRPARRRRHPPLIREIEAQAAQFAIVTPRGRRREDAHPAVAELRARRCPAGLPRGQRHRSASRGGERCRRTRRRRPTWRSTSAPRPDGCARRSAARRALPQRGGQRAADPRQGDVEVARPEHLLDRVGVLERAGRVAGERPHQRSGATGRTGSRRPRASSIVGERFVDTCRAGAARSRADDQRLGIRGPIARFRSSTWLGEHERVVRRRRDASRRRRRSAPPARARRTSGRAHRLLGATAGLGELAEACVVPG